MRKKADPQSKSIDFEPYIVAVTAAIIDENLVNAC